MNNPPQPPRVISPVQADAGMIGGVYANGLNVWHTSHEFTLDFVVNAEPPKRATGPGGQEVISAPQRLVARVRIPPGMVFDLIRAIENNLTNYEQALGQITRRDDDAPLYPPEDLGDTG